MAVLFFVIEAALDFLYLLSRRRENLLSQVAADACSNDPGAGKTGIKRQWSQLSCVWRVWPCDHQECLGAMLTSDHRFITQTSIAIELLTSFSGDILGHVTQHQRNFVADIHSFIGVIAGARARRNGKSVACKHNLTFKTVVRGKGERPKVFLDFE